MLLAMLGWVATHADIPTPAQITAYFTAGVQPYDAPVNFEISCWGYRSDPGEPEKEPGSYTPEVVYTYTASCPGYGCTLEHDLYFNYRHIDFVISAARLAGSLSRLRITLIFHLTAPISCRSRWLASCALRCR